MDAMCEPYSDLGLNKALKSRQKDRRAKGLQDHPAPGDSLGGVTGLSTESYSGSNLLQHFNTKQNPSKEKGTWSEIQRKPAQASRVLSQGITRDTLNPPVRYSNTYEMLSSREAH